MMVVIAINVLDAWLKNEVLSLDDSQAMETVLVNFLKQKCDEMYNKNLNNCNETEP